MNLANFKIVKSFIRSFLFSFFFFAQVKVHADWKIDLSKRQTTFNKIVNTREPASVEQEEKVPTDSELIQAFKNVKNPIVPSQDIVILQTENGFVPEVVRLKKNETYKIHVVNLNSKEKNTSFLVEAFSQTHNTVYGEVKTMTVEPKVDGVFSFQSPETGVAGKFVITTDQPLKKKLNLKRQLASEKKE